MDLSGLGAGLSHRGKEVLSNNDKRKIAIPYLNLNRRRTDGGYRDIKDLSDIHQTY